jgi:hypothetical protein
VELLLREVNRKTSFLARVFAQCALTLWWHVLLAMMSRLVVGESYLCFIVTRVHSPFVAASCANEWTYYLYALTDYITPCVIVVEKIVIANRISAF